MTRMLSSRATIAAGTRPPRVTATIASNGPAPLSRQASARESRWNSSHETGNGFCGCRGCPSCCGSGMTLPWPGPRGEHPCLALPASGGVLAHVEDEIEPRRQAIACLRELHQQLLVEQPVLAVAR